MPDPTKPDPTKPDATKPDATKPDATKPVRAKPDATKPVRAKPDQTFPKRLRVVKGDHFSRALRGGGCAADGALVLFAFPRESQPREGERLATRLGVTIPKKTGNAVVRNQWKRVIREAFRLQKDQMPAGYDLVVRPKKDAVLDGKSIRKGLPKLASRAVKRLK